MKEFSADVLMPGSDIKTDSNRVWAVQFKYKEIKKVGDTGESTWVSLLYYAEDVDRVSALKVLKEAFGKAHPKATEVSLYGPIHNITIHSR